MKVVIVISQAFRAAFLIASEKFCSVNGSIAERKWEIGLRKAIGADNKSILLQFLIESLFLCFTGAIIGLAISVIMIVSVGFLANINMKLSWYAIIISISFCSGVGLFFGIFPAIKASKLDPLECLEQ